MIQKYSLLEIINLLGEEPQKLEGLHVRFSIPFVTDLPLKFPLRLNKYLVFITTKGRLLTQINLSEYELKKGNIIIIPPNAVIQDKEVSSDFEQITLSFNIDFVKECSFKNSSLFVNFLVGKNLNLLKSEPENFEFIVLLCKALLYKNTIHKITKYNKDIILNIFTSFMFEIIQLTSDHLQNDKVLSRKELIFTQLLILIESNFKIERKIIFYADRLSISVSYLNKICKEITKKSVVDLINYSLVTEAKLQLSDPSLSILEISGDLGFNDQSTFGKFFKNKTGFSPSDYRKRILF